MSEQRIKAPLVRAAQTSWAPKYQLMQQSLWIKHCNPFQELWFYNKFGKNTREGIQSDVGLQDQWPKSTFFAQSALWIIWYRHLEGLDGRLFIQLIWWIRLGWMCFEWMWFLSISTASNRFCNSFQEQTRYCVSAHTPCERWHFAICLHSLSFIQQLFIGLIGVAATSSLLFSIWVKLFVIMGRS